MHTLASQAQPYFRNYVRSGGKAHRKKQVGRIIKFLDWAEETQRVRTLDGLGKRQVVGFWKAHRGLSDATANKYWLGINKLWQWLGKHHEPPKPIRPKPHESFLPSILESAKTKQKGL